jgi:hypothetical protein
LIEATESTGIIVSSRFKIETELKNRQAFDEKSAIQAEQSMLNLGAILRIMEDKGLIGRTVEGKIYMTEKGKQQQLQGFSVSQIPPHTVVRFSRNK